MLGLAAVARPLILILIGEKWLPAVTYLQILCFGGMLYPLHAINLNILQVKGRSDLFLRLEIIKKVIGIAPIALGIFYGIEYMLCGSVVTSVIAYFLNSYYSAELIHYPTWAQVRDILPALLVSLGVALVKWNFAFDVCFASFAHHGRSDYNALQFRCNDTFFVVERYQARVCGHRSGNLQYRRK